MKTDTAQRFIFENTDIRGELVTLQQSYQDIVEQHYYPEPIARLLGEFLAASVLLSSTVKFEGRLVLQARSTGDIPLLMVECSHEKIVRGLVRFSDDVISEDFDKQFSKGTLVITIEPLKGEKYQGLVSMDANSLSGCLEAYFMQSEQLATRLLLQADGKTASGLLLQQLPMQVEIDEDEREQQWQHVLQLAQTLTAEEQLSLSHNDVLYRLYHQDHVRLFEEQPVTHRCSCSRERTEQALITVGLKELDTILQEDGEVTMNCEFCNHTYRFAADDIHGLFQS